MNITGHCQTGRSCCQSVLCFTIITGLGFDCLSCFFFFLFDLMNFSYINNVIIKLLQATLDESLYELAGELVLF